MTDNLFLILLFYLKRNLKTIIVFSFSTIIFIIVFLLYSISIDAVIYAFLLSFLFGIIIFIYDFYKYYNKYKTLNNLENKITISTENLPETNDLLESEYQKLLCILYDEKMELNSKADAKQAETIDYYTLWVHQIKTPISAMRLLLQSDTSYYKSQLLLELFKIEQYVEMVLQYLRLYSTSSDLVFKKYNLYNIVKQAVKKYSIVFVQKKIVLDLEQMETYVLTDEKWIQFVIEQILSNALKYTSKGTISIYMDKTSTQTLVIEDTGMGISEEDLPRIFDKGFTGYNGRIDKKSTGIGLYLCKKIITKLSHSIIITSKVSVGTKVKIDFSMKNTFIQ